MRHARALPLCLTTLQQVPRALQQPTCRFKLEKCARGDVPQAPREEVPHGEETSRVVVKSVDPHAEETVVELDEWLIEFANLFRDQLNVDPDKCGAASPRALCRSAQQASHRDTCT
jgi:hypothetical protein